MFFIIFSTNKQNATFRGFGDFVQLQSENLKHTQQSLEGIA